MRKTILAAALSMLVLPAATAFASEGTFRPTEVASAAQGPAIDAGIGQSFVFSQGEGGQVTAAPAVPAAGQAPGSRVAGGSFRFNAGLNG